MKNANLPAMPLCYDARMMGAYSKGEAMGLTKREMLAMAAMQGILSAGVEYTLYDDSDVAKAAVDHADNLLAELEKTPC